MILPHELEPLKALKQWVNYDLEPKQQADGTTKNTKIPKQFVIDQHGNARKINASSVDNSHWATYETAEHYANTGAASGVGIVFGNGLMGVDLDNVIHNGKLIPEAAEIVRTMATYTEYSPSGTGLHMLCYGKMPVIDGEKQTHRTGHVTADGIKWEAEMYDSGRFFTVTGKPYGAPMPINNAQDGIERVYRGYVRKQPKTAENKPQEPRRNMSTAIPADDQELLSIAMQANNGQRFTALYFNGDLSAYAGDESRADQALCNLLAFWTACDAGRIDRLFRASALYRPKWDEKRGADTYGNITIKTAIDGTQETYTGKITQYDADGVETPKKAIETAINPEYITALRNKLEETTQPVYIVGTAEDAQALNGIGVRAFSIGSVNGNYAADYLQAFKYAEKLPPLVVSLQADNEVKETTCKELKKILNGRNARVLSQDLKKGYSSIVEMVTANGKTPAMITTTSEFDALSLQRFREEHDTNNAVDSLIGSLTDANAHKHISCGLKNLDRMINGGFTDGFYVLISTTGAGKTSLCLQMADYMASIAGANTPVLYFSLEMPKDELLAKNFSRHLKENKKEITAGDILDFANKQGKYSQKMPEYLGTVARAYKKDIAPNMYFITEPPAENNTDGHTRITAEDVAFITRDFIRRTNRKPVVFVDYFQLLGKTPEQVRNRVSEVEKAGDDAFILKSLSRKEDAGVPVIAICSTARGNNDRELDITAAKYSGDIEYTANAVIGMQVKGIAAAQGNKLKLQELKKEIREKKNKGEPYGIEVKLLKDRFNPEGYAELEFISKFGLFRDKEYKALNWDDTIEAD